MTFLGFPGTLLEKQGPVFMCNENKGVTSIDNIDPLYSTLHVKKLNKHLSLCLSILRLIAGCDGCHARGRRRLLDPELLVVLLAGPVSHTSTQYKNFVGIFNISPNLSTIYCAHFSRYWHSYVYSCHSVLECCNLFSGVEYKTVLFCSHDFGNLLAFSLNFLANSLTFLGFSGQLETQGPPGNTRFCFHVY